MQFNSVSVLKLGLGSTYNLSSALKVDLWWLLRLLQVMFPVWLHCDCDLRCSVKMSEADCDAGKKVDCSVEGAAGTSGAAQVRFCRVMVQKIGRLISSQGLAGFVRVCRAEVRAKNSQFISQSSFKSSPAVTRFEQ